LLVLSHSYSSGSPRWRIWYEGDRAGVLLKGNFYIGESTPVAKIVLSSDNIKVFDTIIKGSITVNDLEARYGVKSGTATIRSLFSDIIYSTTIFIDSAELRVYRGKKYLGEGSQWGWLEISTNVYVRLKMLVEQDLQSPAIYTNYDIPRTKITNCQIEFVPDGNTPERIISFGDIDLRYDTFKGLRLVPGMYIAPESDLTFRPMDVDIQSGYSLRADTINANMLLLDSYDKESLRIWNSTDGWGIRFIPGEDPCKIETIGGATLGFYVGSKAKPELLITDKIFIRTPLTIYPGELPLERIKFILSEADEPAIELWDSIKEKAVICYSSSSAQISFSTNTRVQGDLKINDYLTLETSKISTPDGVEIEMSDDISFKTPDELRFYPSKLDLYTKIFNLDSDRIGIEFRKEPVSSYILFRSTEDRLYLSDATTLENTLQVKKDVQIGEGLIKSASFYIEPLERFTILYRKTEDPNYWSRIRNYGNAIALEAGTRTDSLNDRIVGFCFMNPFIDPYGRFFRLLLRQQAPGGMGDRLFFRGMIYNWETGEIDWNSPRLENWVETFVRGGFEANFTGGINAEAGIYNIVGNLLLDDNVDVTGTVDGRDISEDLVKVEGDIMTGDLIVETSVHAHTLIADTTVFCDVARANQCVITPEIRAPSPLIIVADGQEYTFQTVESTPMLTMPSRSVINVMQTTYTYTTVVNVSTTIIVMENITNIFSSSGTFNTIISTAARISNLTVDTTVECDGLLVSTITGKSAVNFVPDIPSSELSFGTWEKIFEYTVPANTTAIEITGLDLDNDKIYELVFNAKNPTVSRTDYYLYFNGDTTNTNYYAQWMWVEGTRVSCARTNKPYLMELGSGTSGIVICKIIRAIDGMARYNASATMGSLETIRSLDIKGSWITSANVTSIRIQSEIATAIAANSKVYLMRLSK